MDSEEETRRREKKERKRARREAAAAAAVLPAEEEEEEQHETHKSSKRDKKHAKRSKLDDDVAPAATDNDDDTPLTTLELAKARFPADFVHVFDVATQGFMEPTAIQARVWGLLLSGKDVVGIAATGSGKTLAFTLPAVSRMLTTLQRSKHNNKKTGTTAFPSSLVLSPTRELCIQNFQVAKKCCDATGGRVTACVVYGGQSRTDQQKTLQHGADFLIATPGRLLDFMETRHVDLSRCQFIVLDEADRMLDMGFEKDVRRILAGAPSTELRQTLMFSATWPTEIRAIAHDFLKRDFAKVVIGGENLKAASTVEQIVNVMEPNEKDKALLQVLKERHHNNRVIVFALYKKEAERVERMLKQQRFSVEGVHGDKSQSDRERAVGAFTRGDALILVATDVASRGLDIKGVELVINYTFPLTIEDYVHRIGRTGRAGQSGVAVTFFTSMDKIRAGELQNVLREAGAHIPPELKAFGGTVKKKEHALYGAHFKPVDGTDGAMAKPTRMTFSDSDDDE